MYRVFIVEDDETIAREVAALAEKWDFSVSVCRDFRNVTAEFAAAAPHVVLLDIALPFFNGYHWCSEIRRISQTPIMFISSASDNMSIVMAMDMGGDDFIAKPFDGNVLMAKLRSLLRRSYDFASSAPILEHRGAFLNTGDSTLLYGRERLELTRNEYRILHCLLENKGRVVSRERLMERLWESDCFVDDNTLSVNVNRLRKKLDALGLTELFSTRVGAGYIIE